MGDMFQYAEFKEDEKTEGFSPCLYNLLSVKNGYKLTEQLDPDCTTLLQHWKKTVEKYPSKNCMGHIVEQRYVWRTYQETYEEVQALAKTLWNMNLISYVEAYDKSFRMLGIFSKNRPEWAISNWAIMHFSGTVVPLYSTLGEDSLKYAFEHTELTTVA